MPVRVVISPSQSSFFAGEPFSATICFTNVAAPEPSPARTHKRSAHSVSSAPLARPPTSPGLPPRKPSAFTRDTLPVRKGLIGAPVVPDRPLFVETRQLPASPRIPAPLSRTDTLVLSSDHPHARKSSILDGQLFLDALSPTTSIPPRPHTPPSLTTISESSHTPSSPLSLSSTSPTAPLVSSPLSPSPSYSHPSGSSVQAYPSAAESRPHHHRRFSQQVQLGLSHPSPPLPPQPQPPQSAFTPTFPKSNNNNAELILYSYVQLVGTVYVLPTRDADATPEQTLRMNRIRRMLLRRRAVLGGGSMDISQSLHHHHHRGGSSISGGIRPLPTPQPTPSRRKIHQPYQQHSRSASFSQSLMSLLSPTPSSTPTSGGLQRTHSYDNVSVPGGGHGLGLGIATPTNVNLSIDEIVDPETALPTFEAQPSMLAVDLLLAPGESKSYTYMIKLPEVLPPTYRGRALSFSYELVVGTCKAHSSLSPTAGGISVSRVMKVPIRVYNHVTVDHPPRPYDILWPVMHSRARSYHQLRGEKEMGVGIPEVQGRVVEENDIDAEERVAKWMGVMRRKKASVRVPSGGREGEDEAGLDELRSYTKRLLSSLPPPPAPPPAPNAVNGKIAEEEDEDEVVSPLSSLADSSSTSSLPPSSTTTMTTTTIAVNNSSQPELKNKIIIQDEEEDKYKDSSTECREAVEILTRLPKKASYDVNKEGVKVAVLTFTKSAYRLGETVCGVVELNERAGRSRVVQLSAILEAHEILPKTVGGGGGGGLVRRAYAEHYASFTLNTVRTTFALDIPSDASPAFQVRIDDDERVSPTSLSASSSSSSSAAAVGGLEWKIRLCLLVGIASTSRLESESGEVLFRSLERDGGRGEWGSSWCAPRRFVPLEKKSVGGRKDGKMRIGEEEGLVMTRSWTRVLVDSMWGAVTGVGVDEEELSPSSPQHFEEREKEKEKARQYDGIKPDLGGGIGSGVDFSGDADDVRWEEVKMETVECEVPVKVWPGNTAFRAVEVVFDV